MVQATDLLYWVQRLLLSVGVGARTLRISAKCIRATVIEKTQLYSTLEHKQTVTKFNVLFHTNTNVSVTAISQNSSVSYLHGHKLTRAPCTPRTAAAAGISCMFVTTLYRTH